MTGGAGPELSGRVLGGPAALLRTEVLEPQLRYELVHLLPHYLAVERALTAEACRLGVLSAGQAAAVDAVLRTVTADDLLARAPDCLSDLALTLEREVEAALPEPVPAWHVDRSRNDYQACAQLMFGRQRLVDLAGTVLVFCRAVHAFAARHVDTPMPGYTHLQAAQLITPGFYFAALVDRLQHGLRRLLATHDAINACPLGAGAMAGQELAWDRDGLARALGFGRSQPSALVSVADRGWTLEVTAELGVLAVQLSRFVTDMMAWGGSALGWLDLPDELAGISAAMPQKKNFPVLERVRGRLAHVSACHLDAVLGQRNTPYANSVEVSKEAGARLADAFAAMDGALRLCTAVVDAASLDRDRMALACGRDYFGGFALANRLTLLARVPWRTAQVVAGRYVVAATAAGLPPARTDPALLAKAAAASGVELPDPAGLLAGVFDVAAALHSFRTAGSAHPAAVAELLGDQERRTAELTAEWDRRRAAAGGGGDHRG
ncbi:lyase family protein [Actinophytocola sp. KF-1]